MTLNQSFKELTSTRVAKYCGDRQPGPQEEDTNSLKVVLHSDEEGTRNGFRAKYEFIKRPAQDKRQLNLLQSIMIDDVYCIALHKYECTRVCLQVCIIYVHMIA